jgi:hypothetical protein
MEDIAGEAAHNRPSPLVAPIGGGEAYEGALSMMGWTSAAAGSLTASVTSNADGLTNHGRAHGWEPPTRSGPERVSNQP